jgi:16S rRNA (guanine527-N7)-methyltransferase
VKSEAVRNLEATLTPWVEMGGALAPDTWAERLACYLDLLRDWNRRINLVSRKSIDRVVEEQLIPSLAVLRVVAADTAVRALDVGSGGGFPGIPLAILRPRVRIDLVESVEKKCRFLEEAVRALGLVDAAVQCCRIEHPSAELVGRGPFDVAFARAVGNPSAVGRAVVERLAPGASLWGFCPPEDPSASVRWPPTGAAVTALQVLATGT